MERYHKASFYKYDKFYTIYRGIDLITEQPVWIKVINKEFYFTRNFGLRFDQWSRLLGSLDHPNIVKYIGFVKNLDEYLIVTEYFEPNPISDILQLRSLSYDEIKHIYNSILNTYNYLHSKNLLNVDIDLRKIHILNDGQIKIEDCALLNLLFDRFFRYKEFYLQDYSFISPELIKDMPLDKRNDIYSLGVLLYTLVEGIKPFPKNLNKNQITQKILTEELPLPRRTSKFNQIIIKATHKDPEQRYQSVDKIKQDFNQIIIPEQQTDIQLNSQPYNVLKIKNPDKDNNLQSPNTAKRQTRPRKSTKPHRVKYKTILQTIGIIAFAIIDIFILWLILKNLNKPLDYHNYLIYNEPEKLKIFHWSNNTYITALCDTGIYNLVLDINDTILHDTYFSFSDLNLNNLTFHNGIIYYVGYKLNDGTIPALLLIYKTYYEPYFNTDFYGKFATVTVKNNFLYLLKTNTQDSSLLEIRTHDMSLYKNIPLPKPLEKQDYLKILPISKNKILILSIKVSPTYMTMNDVIHKPDTFYLQAFDTLGNMLWQHKFSSMSNTYINTSGDAYFVTYLNSEKQLILKKFNPGGKQIDSISITLPYRTTLLTSAINDTSSITLLLQSNKYNYLLKTSMDGKILWTTKLEPVRKMQYTDLTKIANGQIMAVGYFKNNLLSKINGIDLYLIHTIKINSQNGSYKRMTLKQAIKSYIHQNYENPFSKK